jgi:hypothetical protein
MCTCNPRQRSRMCVGNLIHKRGSSSLTELNKLFIKTPEDCAPNTKIHFNPSNSSPCRCNEARRLICVSGRPTRSSHTIWRLTCHEMLHRTWSLTGSSKHGNENVGSIKARNPLNISEKLSGSQERIPLHGDSITFYVLHD